MDRTLTPHGATHRGFGRMPDDGLDDTSGLNDLDLGRIGRNS
ncbi:hypothetical protein HPT29_005650 [Microvirga terrae]|uniref:Uncharacterized protein n=1 Tax=Microvirga terrae TaxID=2740529 RepID=A0ABY5RTM6_9HYPH|nr:MULTISPECIES: hypothetical protein [Microvirga]UVF20615.1 hypothetical protein HPT29_005650 [Microvirga terrae]